MFFIFLVAIVNLALGFAVAIYLGGHYRMERKFGIKIPVPHKAALALVKTSEAVSVAQPKSELPVELPAEPTPGPSAEPTSEQQASPE